MYIYIMDENIIQNLWLYEQRHSTKFRKLRLIYAQILQQSVLTKVSYDIT